MRTAPPASFYRSFYQALERRAVLAAWKAWQQTEQEAVGSQLIGWVFTDANANPIHPHSTSQTLERIATRAGVPKIRLHDIRHTHGTLLIRANVPVNPLVRQRLWMLRQYHGA